jgi:phosphohistidine phosphatase SixA
MSIDANGIHLAWTNPNPGMSFAKVKILRALNATPAGPDDAAAALVYTGPAEAASDDLTKLLPDTSSTKRTYYYTAYACTQDDLCETQGSTTEASPTVIQCLAAGGYTLFWRHASADVCADATHLGTAENAVVADWWKSCDANCPAGGGGTATARQLNAKGVMEATTIGLDMATRGVPIGRVRSSEFCRCIQTAENMAFPAPIEQEPDLTYYVYDEANRCSSSMAMLAETPMAGTNTAHISHSGLSCPVLDQLLWGEAAIYKPDGAGGALFIARVTANGWLALP